MKSNFAGIDLLKTIAQMKFSARIKVMNISTCSKDDNLKRLLLNSSSSYAVEMFTTHPFSALKTLFTTCTQAVYNPPVYEQKGLINNLVYWFANGLSTSLEKIIVMESSRQE